jgi:hypothetical protein
MTRDGVAGIAARLRLQARNGTRVRRQPFIKRDDGRLAQRYIGPTYPHTPAGAIPNSFRRERQVASALHNDVTDFAIASLNYSAGGTAEAVVAASRARCRPTGSGKPNKHPSGRPTPWERTPWDRTPRDRAKRCR